MESQSLMRLNDFHLWKVTGFGKGCSAVDPTDDFHGRKTLDVNNLRGIDYRKTLQNPENFTVDSHKPVQTSRGVPWVDAGLYTHLCTTHTCPYIHLSTSYSCPTDGEHARRPHPSLQERPEDLSRSGPISLWPALHTQLRKHPATPAWAPVGRILAPDAPGSFSPSRSLVFQSDHTHLPV